MVNFAIQEELIDELPDEWQEAHCATCSVMYEAWYHKELNERELKQKLIQIENEDLWQCQDCQRNFERRVEEFRLNQKENDYE